MLLKMSHIGWVAIILVAVLAVAGGSPAAGTGAMNSDTVLPEHESPATAQIQAEPEKKEAEHKESGDKVKGAHLGAFWLIIGFLITVTVAFEVIKHYIEHLVRHTNAENIVKAVWGELTVLGFLAIVCFTINQAGTASLSLELYGEGETEEEKKEREEAFGENLETVHMIIFVIMVVFLCQALATIVYLSYKRKVGRCIARCGGSGG